MPKRYWLVKSEPDVFSWDDLLKAPKRTTHWEGVRNYQARNFLRDSMKLGDAVFFYHSNTDEPGIQGICEVVKEGYPDPDALNPKSPYFDEDAKKKGQNPWVRIDLKATHRLKSPATLEALKGKKGLEKMELLRRGSRLSVQPVAEAEFKIVCALAPPIAIGSPP